MSQSNKNNRRNYYNNFVSEKVQNPTIFGGSPPGTQEDKMPWVSTLLPEKGQLPHSFQEKAQHWKRRV